MTPTWLALLSGALLAGAASSFHCVAMCGPLLVAGGGGPGAVRHAVGYHAGRLTSYALGGAVAGALGRWLIPGPAGATLRVAAGVLAALALLVAAVRLVARSRAAASRIHAPGEDAGGDAFVTARRLRRPTDGFGLRATLGGVATALWSALPRRGLGLGLVTGFLPCGALATGLALAASSGSAARGSSAMVTFALGSGPALVVVALVGRRLVGNPALSSSTTWGRRLRWAGAFTLVAAAAVIGSGAIAGRGACH